MAGYRIEYTGGAVQRKDVSQATGNSSLTQSTLVSPAYMNGDSFPVSNYYTGQTDDYESAPYPGPRPYDVLETGTSFTQGVNSGGVNYYGASANITHRVYFVSPVFPSGGTVYIRAQKTNGIGGMYLYHDGISTFSNGTYFNLNGTGGATFWTTSYSVPAGRYFIARVAFNNEPYAIGVDYMNFYQNSSVLLAPSTFVNGANPTGGTAVTPSVVTTQSGTVATAGAAKSFGADVKHNGITILRPRYYPPADNSQQANVNVSQSKVITAESTSLTVEGIGLGGSEKLRSYETSLIVKDLQDATEN